MPLKKNTTVRASSKLALKFWGLPLGGIMGIKQTDHRSFIEPESTGFINDTARSFLKRHSDPKSLLSQLKNLFHQGEYSSCVDLIQLIIRENHTLSDRYELYVLRAQLAFTSSDSLEEVSSWIKQASLCNDATKSLESWTKFISASLALKEGDYSLGENLLKELLSDEAVGMLAQYHLSYHLFWRNIDPEQSLFLLEELTHQHPELIKAWSCLGFVYNRLGLQDKAQSAFSYCLSRETNPNKIQLYKQQLVS